MEIFNSDASDAEESQPIRNMEEFNNIPDGSHIKINVDAVMNMNHAEIVETLTVMGVDIDCPCLNGEDCALASETPDMFHRMRILSDAMRLVASNEQNDYDQTLTEFVADVLRTDKFGPVEIFEMLIFTFARMHSFEIAYRLLNKRIDDLDV